MPRQRSKKDWERWVEETLKGRHLSEPPHGTLRRAIALGSELGSRKSGAGGWLAKLVFDSAIEPLPVGVRGAPAGERRLLFQFPPGSVTDESAELDLRVRRESRGTVELTGQILPPIPGAWIEARSARTRRRQRLGNEGEFLVRGLSAASGTLRLEICREGSDPLVVEDVPLRPTERE